jgi:hypothetical protein
MNQQPPFPPPQQPQQPRRGGDGRAAKMQQQVVPTGHLMQMLHETKQRYDDVSEMLRRHDNGYRRLAFEVQQTTNRLGQRPATHDAQGNPIPTIQLPDGRQIDARLYRLHVSLQASLRAGAMVKVHLEQQLEVDRFVHGELERFVSGQPPTDFQGPQSNVPQPSVPGQAPILTPQTQPAPQLMPPQLAYPQFAQPQQQYAQQQQPQQMQQPQQQMPVVQLPSGQLVPLAPGQMPSPQALAAYNQQMAAALAAQQQGQPQQPQQPSQMPQGQHIFGPYPGPPGAPPVMVVDPRHLDPRQGQEVLATADHMPSMQLPVAHVPYDPASLNGPPPPPVPQYMTPEQAAAATFPNAPPAPVVTAPAVQYPTAGSARAATDASLNAHSTVATALQHQQQQQAQPPQQPPVAPPAPPSNGAAKPATS